MESEPSSPETSPSPFNYILSFILVGIAWGFTTPFIRRAAVDFNKRQEITNQRSTGTGNSDAINTGQQQRTAGWNLTKKLIALFWTVVNLLRTPAYAIPLVVNLTGSVWFFLLVGKHGMKEVPTKNFFSRKWRNISNWRLIFVRFSTHIELSLTVPISNSMAFLFTVLGEWYVERKVIAKETWLGMFLVLGGIALCVQSKNHA